MTRFLMRLFAFALLAGSALSLRAVTTYQLDNTGGACVSSRTIHASDSAMTSAQYAVTVYANPASVPASQSSATIETRPPDLSLSFFPTYFPTRHSGLN